MRTCIERSVEAKVVSAKNGMWSHSDLQRRGWTQSLIRRYAGEPDATVENPRYRTPNGMKLFDKTRILTIEASKEFKEALVKSIPRRIAGVTAAAECVEEAVEIVDALNIRLPDLSLSKVLERAIDDYNQRAPEHRQETTLASRSSDPQTLRRITVDYLVALTGRYDEELLCLYGRPGLRLAYTYLRWRVLQAIEEKFPRLAPECASQVAALLSDGETPHGCLIPTSRESGVLNA